MLSKTRVVMQPAPFLFPVDVRVPSGGPFAWFSDQGYMLTSPIREHVGDYQEEESDDDDDDDDDDDGDDTDDADDDGDGDGW